MSCLNSDRPQLDSLRSAIGLLIVILRRFVIPELITKLKSFGARMFCREDNRPCRTDRVWLTRVKISDLTTEMFKGLVQPGSSLEPDVLTNEAFLSIRLRGTPILIQVQHKGGRTLFRASGSDVRELELAMKALHQRISSNHSLELYSFSSEPLSPP
ncbi:hypothetical protein Tco_0308401 [Tanacetum coccineum]